VTILSGIIFQEEDQISTLNALIMVVSALLNILFILKWTSLMLQIYEEKHKSLR